MENQTAIDELQRGRHFASQLKHLLDSTTDFKSQADGSAEDLVARILSTFTHSLSLLTSINNAGDEEDDSRDRQSSDGRKSEGSSGDGNKRSATRMKQKRTSPESWVKESTNLVDDGYGWRKYGQKNIIKSEFPRLYYRCTHKKEQNCQATKQVQMITQRHSPDQLIYRTTYYSRHTCNNNGGRQIMLQEDETVDYLAGCQVISFGKQGGQLDDHDVMSRSFPLAAMSAVLGGEIDKSGDDVVGSGGQMTGIDDADRQGANSTSSSNDSCSNDSSNDDFMRMMMMTRMESFNDFEMLLGLTC